MATLYTPQSTTTHRVPLQMTLVLKVCFKKLIYSNHVYSYSYGQYPSSMGFKHSNISNHTFFNSNEEFVLKYGVEFSKLGQLHLLELKCQAVPQMSFETPKPLKHGPLELKWLSSLQWLKITYSLTKDLSILQVSFSSQNWPKSDQISFNALNYAHMCFSTFIWPKSNVFQLQICNVTSKDF